MRVENHTRPWRPPQSFPRPTSIGPAPETVQHSLMAGPIYLEDHTLTSCAAGVRRPVQVSRGIDGQSSLWLGPVTSCAKVVQHCLVTAGIRSDHGALVPDTALVGGSIEVACGIDKPRLRPGVTRSREDMQQS